eukprot:730591_1
MMAPSAEDQNTKFVKYILRTMNITDQNFTLRELVVSDILGTLSMHDHRTVLCKSCSCDSDDIKSATADDMDVSQPESDIMPTPTGCDWVSPEHNPKNILRSIFKTSLLYKPKNEDTLGQKTTDFEEGGGIEKLSVLVRYCIDGLLGENRLSPATCRPAKGRCCPATHFSSATSPDLPVQSPATTPYAMYNRPICPDTSTFLHMPMPSNFDPFAYHLGRGPYFGQMYPTPIEFTKPTQCLAYSDMIPDIVPAMIPTTLPATTPQYVGHAHTMSVVPATSFADGRRSRKRSIVPQTYAAQPRFKMRKTCPSLEVGTKIDAFSVALNQWFPAEIVEVRRGQLSQARLHFRDWGSLWDEWMVLDTGCNRVAELGSESVMTKTNSLMIILLHAVDLLRIMVDIDVRLAVKVANTGVVSHLARFVPLHSSLSFNDELIFGPSIELCITLISKYGSQFNKFGKIYKSRDSRLVRLLQNRCNLPYDVSRIIDMYTPGHSTVMSDILDIIGSVQPLFERILFSKCHRSINDSLRVMYELTYNDEFLRMFFSEMSLRRIAEIIVNPRGQFIDEPIAEAIITLQQVVVATDECTCIDPESVQNRLAPLGIIEAVLRELEQKKGQWFQPRPDRPLLDVLDMIALLFAITRSKENQAVAVQAGCWSVLLDIALHSSQQAGSEVSALLGNIPSAVGYQPTLATEMGELQERIVSTNKGSITSVQAIYVPADDLTDPAPAATFEHLDATTVLNRKITYIGVYPAVDPLDSSSDNLSPAAVGYEHFGIATEIRQMLQTYQQLQDIVAILGMDELSEADKLTVERARKAQRFFSQPFHVASQFTGKQGLYVTLADTLTSFRKLCNGEMDHLPEEAFYMRAGYDSVVERAEEIALQFKTAEEKADKEKEGGGEATSESDKLCHLCKEKHYFA